jgi:hypothetical protein
MVFGISRWHCAVNYTHTGQHVNEHPGISVVNRVEHWTTEKAQQIAIVFGTKEIGSTDVVGV